MKKNYIIFAFVLCAVIVLCFINFYNVKDNEQEHVPSDVYAFPITAADPEWQSFSSSAERLEAMQIPSDILETISTKGLIQTILDYPLLPDIYAYSSDIAFSQMYQQFNGIQEVCKREDAGTSLLAYYSQVQDKVQQKALDLLLSSSYIQAILTEAEKDEYVGLQKKYELRNKDGLM